MRTLPLWSALLLLPTMASAADLMAGQHTVAGDVTVTDDGTDLIVTVDMDADYAFTAVHLAAGCDLADIPTTKKGNPKPGHFAYGVTDTCSWAGEWRIPLADLDCDGELVVAFHAVVHEVIDEVTGDLTGIGDLTSPAVAKFATNTDAYFQTTVNGEAYDGWCVNLDNYVSYTTYKDVELYSSYSAEAEYWVDKPENLDLVNYMINADYSKYSWQSLQEAIWVIIDDKNKAIPGGNATHRAAIVADAKAHGEGFEPGFDDVYAVMLVKDSNDDGRQDIQVTIIEVPVPVDPVCGEDSETGWGDGERFVEKGSWATYMTYSLGK